VVTARAHSPTSPVAFKINWFAQREKNLGRQRMNLSTQE